MSESASANEHAEVVCRRGAAARIRLIYWSNKPDLVREALRYIRHFVRIGVSRAIAPAVGAEIKATGRKLNITNWHFGRADWDELSALRPDAFGIDDYSKLLELSRRQLQSSDVAVWR